MSEGDLLSACLARPANLVNLDTVSWEVLIRQARSSDLLATLAYTAGTIFDHIPRRVQIQLETARHVAEHRATLIRWEVEGVHDILDLIGVPIILLKGAAYVVADLEVAQGRIFGDIDIMVPHGALNDVERALGRHGWIQESRSAYDDRYYRQWMHEIPARRHIERGTILDVHHNILPLTARNKPSATALWKSCIPITGWDDLYVLSPEDMALHCAAHLFLNSEFEHGLRDLNDFRRLCLDFSTKPDFWEHLYARAKALDLIQPLHYAVRYANRRLQAHFPEPGTSPRSSWYQGGMDVLFEHALRPYHSSVRDRITAVALFVLYVRGHYLRMPLSLLLPHLIYKGTWAKMDEQKLQNENAKKLQDFKYFINKPTK